VQFVAVPDESDFHAKIASGQSSQTVSRADAVQWIRSAIERKHERYPDDVRAGMILALDARRAPHDDAVVAGLTAHAPPLDSYGFAEIWLVGPTVPRTRRLV
jgi:hypothetical protein